MEPAQLHYGPREVAEQLGVSVATVWRRINDGDLPSVKAPSKPGRKPSVRVTAAALREFVQEHSRVA